jgi:hypothetical protein
LIFVIFIFLCRYLLFILLYIFLCRSYLRGGGPRRHRRLSTTATGADGDGSANNEDEGIARAEEGDESSSGMVVATSQKSSACVSI